MLPAWQARSVCSRASGAWKERAPHLVGCRWLEAPRRRRTAPAAGCPPTCGTGGGCCRCGCCAPGRCTAQRRLQEWAPLRAQGQRRLEGRRSKGGQCGTHPLRTVLKLLGLHAQVPLVRLPQRLQGEVAVSAVESRTPHAAPACMASLAWLLPTLERTAARQAAQMEKPRAEAGGAPPSLPRWVAGPAPAASCSARASATQTAPCRQARAWVSGAGRGTAATGQSPAVILAGGAV